MIENNCLFLVFEVLNSVCQRATFISQGPSWSSRWSLEQKKIR
jgi:hypothetical protein